MSPPSSSQHLSRFENAVSDGFVCVKYSAELHYGLSKTSSNLSHEEYRQRLKSKWHGVSPTPSYGVLLVNFHVLENQLS